MDLEQLKDKIQGFIDQIKSKLQKDSGAEAEEDSGDKTTVSENKTNDSQTIKMVDAFGRTVISAPLENNDEEENPEGEEGEETQVNTQVTKDTTKDIQAESKEDEAQKKRSMLIKVAALVAIIVVGAPEIMNLLGPEDVNLENLPPPPKKKKRRKKEKKKAFFPNAKKSKDMTSDAQVAVAKDPKKPFFPNAKKPQDMTSDAQVAVAKSPKQPFFPKAKNTSADSAPTPTPQMSPKTADATADSTPPPTPKMPPKTADATADSTPPPTLKMASKTADATADAPIKKAKRGPASISKTPAAMDIPPETPAKPLLVKEASSDQAMAREPAQADEAPMESEKEIEYIAPPNYERRGRGLVYNCAGKHWACVDKFSYFQCRENQVWNERNQKPHECMTKNVYASSKDCVTVQTHSINTAADTSFCELVAEEEN